VRPLLGLHLLQVALPSLSIGMQSEVGTFVQKEIQCFSRDGTELSQQLDGIRATGPAVFVLGATNRLDAIDPAILSRFVEQIEIGLPDQVARQQLLEVFLGNLACEGNPQDIAHCVAGISALTDNYSGRDLQQLCSKVTLIAVKRRGKGEFKINIDDLCEAFHCSRTARLTKIEEKPSLVASQAAPL
jgi:SpoVK/Ycf46/Vps4 family AAA+-type ATPase